MFIRNLLSQAVWRSAVLIGAFVLLPAIVEAEEFAGKAVSLSGVVLVRQDGKAVDKPNYMKASESVNEGDVINTGSNGSVKLLFTDKSIVDLGPSTLFKVDEYKLKQVGNRNVGLSMMYGKIRASVNQPVNNAGKFKVKTRSATMGVRGTEFMVSSDLTDAADLPPAPAEGGEKGEKAPKTQAPQAGQTQITVIKGKVEVNVPTTTEGTKNAPISLTEGKQLTAVAADVGKTMNEASGNVASAKVQVEQLSQTEIADVKQEASSMKVDKTFTQAVVLDDSSNFSAGAETIAAAMGDISVTDMDRFMPQISDFGMAGTFDATLGLSGDFTPTQIGQPVKVRVVFHK